jgi:hypothetical protein
MLEISYAIFEGLMAHGMRVVVTRWYGIRI